MTHISKNVSVYTEVDPYDVLDELNADDIIDYLTDERDMRINLSSKINYSNINYEELAYAYYHGDFNLEKFLEMLEYKRG